MHQITSPNKSADDTGLELLGILEKDAALKSGRQVSLYLAFLIKVVTKLVVGFTRSIWGRMRPYGRFLKGLINRFKLVDTTKVLDISCGREVYGGRMKGSRRLCIGDWWGYDDCFHIGQFTILRVG